MMQINEIMDFLPHRYPFLLVDRIVEVEKGQSIVGYKNVTINEPFFTGHKRPVVPGDQLRLESKMLSNKHGIWKFDCRALVDGEVVCVAEIMSAERDA